MWLYKLLLRLYPVRFREEYQQLMEQEFREEYRETGAKKRFVLRAILDILRTAPMELARELSADLAFAIRVYRRHAFSAALAIAALSLSIGASTAVFSVLNALLLRELPFREPGRIVELSNIKRSYSLYRNGFYAWQAGAKDAIESAALFDVAEMNLSDARDAIRVKVAETSANFFTVLGAPLKGGRGFSAGEDVPSAVAPVAVISHALWQQSYGGDARALGQTVRINGKPLTVIGVAAPLFDFPEGVAVWIPAAFSFETTPKEGAFVHHTIARLAPGVSATQARQMLEAESIDSIRDKLAGPIRNSVWVLTGVVFFVLLAACANVAQLLLARTLEREREFATREALGATRARLTQQLISEALLLSTLGAAAGILVAIWASRLAEQVLPPELASQQYTLLDWRVLGFACALALATGMAFGVAPAWAARSGRRLSARYTRNALLAVQAALTLCLLAGSLTMGGSLLRLLRTDLGFRKDHIATLNVSLIGSPHVKNAQRVQFYREAMEKLRSVPGVESAGAVRHLPLTKTLYMVDRINLDSGQSLHPVILNGAMSGYFSTMGTRVLAGREFAESETQPVLLVNRAFAEQSGLGSAIVGRTIRMSWSKTPYTIAGVVDAAKIAGPAYPSSPQAYFWTLEEAPNAMTFVVRTQAPPEQLLPALRDSIRSLDPSVAVYDVMTIDERLSGLLTQPRFYTAAILFFALLAMLLALIGTFGSAAFAVARRTREIGIRIALGSTPQMMRNFLAGDSLRPIAVGSAIGIAGAIALGQLLEHWIPNVDPLGWRSCALAALGLLSAATAAAWLATSRIARLDPAVALRSE